MYFMRAVSDQELSSLTGTQKDFIMSIRSLDAELQGAQFKKMIAEVFPHARLFDK